MKFYRIVAVVVLPALIAGGVLGAEAVSAFTVGGGGAAMSERDAENGRRYLIVFHPGSQMGATSGRAVSDGFSKVAVWLSGADCRVVDEYAGQFGVVDTIVLDDPEEFVLPDVFSRGGTVVVVTDDSALANRYRAAQLLSRDSGLNGGSIVVMEHGPDTWDAVSRRILESWRT